MQNSDKLNRFDHVVVLMMENRSFDNILGYLSKKVDGVIDKDLSNPAPVRYDGKKVRGASKGQIPVSPGTVMDNPNPDPGEYFPHINTQLYNTIAPHFNAFQKHASKFQWPFNQPIKESKQPIPCYDLPYPAPMTGFVQDYYNKYTSNRWFHCGPGRAKYSVIMNCFPPEVVPIMSGLANNFAVFDKWHCAVPSQTFCNRSFFHAATSNGQVVNTPYTKWLDYESETLFNRLQEQKVSWAIYYDIEDVFPLTLLIHFQKLRGFLFDGNDHFRTMDRFDRDAANGTLPAYSFIEPRLFFNHNDQHPPVKVFFGIFPQRSTVTAGEHLINRVYNAIRNSNTQIDGQSNSENTLLTITYDEHGGCYDHVSPPQCATPPGDNAQAEMDFLFDRLGIRVPTIMVSAWIESGHVVNKPMQHTSMLKTLGKKWNFKPLTKRDESASDFLDVFTLQSPRPGSEWPELTPCSHPKGSEKRHNLRHPLNDLQKAILKTINGIKKEPVKESVLEKMKVGKSLAFMRDVWDELSKS